MITTLTFEAVEELEPGAKRRTLFERHWLGTLYAAVHRPTCGTAEYRWPDVVWRHAFDDFRERRRTVRLLEETAA